MREPPFKEHPTTSSSQWRVAIVGGAGAQIAVLGSDNLDPGAYPTAGPCSNTPLRHNLGLLYVVVCNIHGVPPQQWLEQWGLKTERPPYRDPVLHSHAPRLIALRGGDRNEETPAAGNEGEMLMRRAYARALSPHSFLLLENSSQPTPSPLCRLASWPLLGACSMYPGEQFLT